MAANDGGVGCPQGLDNGPPRSHPSPAVVHSHHSSSRLATPWERPRWRPEITHRTDGPIVASDWVLCGNSREVGDLWNH